MPHVNIGLATMLGGEFPHLTQEVMFSRPNVIAGNHACLPPVNITQSPIKTK